MRTGVVTIFALGGISNVGEAFLVDCTRWLVNANGGGWDVCVEELMPTVAQVGEKLGNHSLARLLLWMSQRAYNCRYLFPASYRYWFLDLAYRIRYGLYYKRCLDNSRCVIYAVGMLKFAIQDFSYVFDLINKIAEKKKIPVMMNAMSIAKSKRNDWRFGQLVRAVNRKSVKMVTTRDGVAGLDRLRNEYVQNKDIATISVGDVALWIPEVYGVRAQSKGGTRIGINVPRFGLFKDYDGGVSDEELMRFYVNLLRTVEASGVECCLFCNGMDADWTFGTELLKRVGSSKIALLPKARTAWDYLNQANGFSAIFAVRFHACVTAFALGIPFLGLIWDDKLRFFAQEFGLSSVFLERNELDGRLVAERLINLLGKDCVGRDKLGIYKDKTKNSFDLFLEMMENA